MSDTTLQWRYYKPLRLVLTGLYLFTLFGFAKTEHICRAEKSALTPEEYSCCGDADGVLTSVAALNQATANTGGCCAEQEEVAACHPKSSNENEACCELHHDYLLPDVAAIADPPQPESKILSTHQIDSFQFAKSTQIPKRPATLTFSSGQVSLPLLH
jgi:hypothetical protein